MKRFSVLLAVALLTMIPSHAFAAYHLGSSELWSNMAEDGAAQATMWLGDVGPVVVLVIGAGLLLMIVTAVISSIKH